MMTALSVASTQQDSSDVELRSSNNKAKTPKYTNSATQVASTPIKNDVTEYETDTTTTEEGLDDTYAPSEESMMS